MNKLVLQTKIAEEARKIAAEMVILIKDAQRLDTEIEKLRTKLWKTIAKDAAIDIVNNVYNYDAILNELTILPPD